MSVKEQMQQAQALIKQQRYDEARALLVQVDHPKATEWIAKIDSLLGQVLAPEKPKNEPLEFPTPVASPVPAPPPSVQVNVTQQVTQQAGPSPVVILKDSDSGPGCLVQFVWFLILGAWLSQAAIIVGYILVLTFLLLPAGLWVLNRVPYLATLRGQAREMAVSQDGGIIRIEHSTKQQRHWLSTQAKVFRYFSSG